MCGILCVAGATSTNVVGVAKGLERIQSRGPDSSSLWSPTSDVIMGFNRLSINGNDGGSNQPFKFGDVSLVCNGEIFNHKELEKELDYTPTSGSDCEVLVAAYRRWGPRKMCAKLDAEFAFFLYDKTYNRVVVSRDPYGVRPLFHGNTVNNELVVSSELKGMKDLAVEDARQFKPGYVYVHNMDTDEQEYIPYNPKGYLKNYINCPTPEKTVKSLVMKAVKKRLMCENGGVCCLLSGGLDSSLVASIAAHYSEKPIHTFSIGLKGAPDLEYAKMVADHIGSVHHEVIVSEDDFIDAIPDVIRAIESYDVTTVRASVGNYLIAKYIRENTGFKVVLNGDYADEVCGGYLYTKLAPSRLEFEMECERLVSKHSVL